MTEFEKAKKRYEKRAKVIDITPPEPPKKRSDSITVTIVDGGKEHSFHFHMEPISMTRIGSQRTADVYKALLEGFIKKEFGKWRSVQTP